MEENHPFHERRRDDGQLLVKVDDFYLIIGYRFFVSPEERYFGVNPAYGAGTRIYHIEDGEQIQVLNEFDSIWFSPDSSYYLVGHSKAAQAVRAYRDLSILLKDEFVRLSRGKANSGRIAMTIF